MNIKLSAGILLFSLFLQFLLSDSAFANAGLVDEAYGTTGYYFDNTWIRTGNIDQTFFTDGAILPDGSVIAVGARLDNDGQRDRRTFYVQKILPSGIRDSSFGGGTGTFRLLNFASGSDSVARTVKVQPDGKIIVAGVCNIFVSPGTQQERQSGYGMCAIRLTAAGDLDASFGGNSVSVQHTPGDPNSYFNYVLPMGTTFLHYPGQVESGYTGANLAVNAAAMDMDLFADGRIALAGYSVTRDFNGSQFLGYNRLATTAILNANGSLNSAFALPGDQTFDSARRNMRAFRGIRAKSDGGVIAVGYNPLINPATNGISGFRWFIYDSGTGATYYSENGVNNSKALAVLLTRSNKILVSGPFTPNGGSFVGTALMRFNSDLTLDNSFGAEGRRFYWHTVADQSNRIGIFSDLIITEVQPDGKILGKGTSGVGEDPLNAGPGGESVYRLNPNGAVDHSIGDSFGGSPTDYFSYGYQTLYRYVNGTVAQRISNTGFAHTNSFGRILAGGTYSPADAGRAGIDQRQSTFRNQFLPDFDNDGSADVSVYRPSNGVWHNLNSFNNSYSPVLWGTTTDKPAPADFDGDGKLDRAVFRDGAWWILRSSDSQAQVVQWGTAGDIPRPGDFNGDGFADIAVFRPSNGNWYILYSSPIQPGNVMYTVAHFGQAGDVPLLADFDGDGKSDVAVFRDGAWYYLRSSDGQVVGLQYGVAGDVPVVADYDGDSKADIAVFRAGVWYVQRSTDGGNTIVGWGAAGDKPVQADYDGDGKCDFGVYRSGVWWFTKSTTQSYGAVSFGVSTDVPLPNIYDQP